MVALSVWEMNSTRTGMCSISVLTNTSTQSWTWESKVVRDGNRDGPISEGTVGESMALDGKQKMGETRLSPVCSLEASSIVVQISVPPTTS